MLGRCLDDACSSASLQTGERMLRLTESVFSARGVPLTSLPWSIGNNFLPVIHTHDPSRRGHMPDTLVD